MVVSGSGEPRYRILLAEDNLINQRVATHLLTRKGHEVVVAENGREALCLFDGNGPFDLVLMDIQMPEMGGFEATIAIRKRETPDRRPVAIVAVTAHAMRGYREQCLEVGMDGYVSKPIRPNILYAEIDRVMATRQGGSRAMTDTNDSANDSAHVDQVFDRDAFMERIGFDVELARELAQLFLNDSASLVESVRRSATAGDADELCRAAHTLKGSVGNFCAKRAFTAAELLEHLGRAGTTEGAANAVETLEREIKALEQMLADLGRDHGTLTG